ncbi:MAG: glycosyltransferase family 4 protein [Alphaproteobacteria bacterium]|nr:glycosyltransferase family 4 protein [Alphaproteobacteria bacterium]
MTEAQPARPPRMRIAITHPTCWPYVRRGSERVLNDCAVWLAGRGHAVTVLSSAPDGPITRTDAHGVRHVLFRQVKPLPVGGRWLNHFHAFGWQCRRAVMEQDFDAVLCLNYHDAWGVCAGRKASGKRFRVLFQLTGIPVRRYFRRIPLDGMLFASAVRRADVVAPLSRFAADMLEKDFGREGVLIPSPSALAPFEAAERRVPARPRILFSGDQNEPRKGARLLARAFPLVREKLADAELVYTGACRDETRAAILAEIPPGLHADVHFLGLGKVEDLPGLYAGASVVTNPAIWEALGNVLIEAQASGTPIVGARHGGIPDIIADARIGTLFDPGDTRLAASNHQGLAEALLETIPLAARPETDALCRANARRFGWDAQGPRYEAALAGLPIPDVAGA